MQKLSGKVAVITGGNSGIGFASAQEFIQQGAKVIITGRNPQAIQEAAQRLGAQAEGFVADVTRIDQIDALFAHLKANYGKVDILFNNAGIFKGTPLGQMDMQVLDDTMNINFRGAVLMTEKLLPLLSEGASIINLSSVLSRTGLAGITAYAASKAALDAFTRTAVTELAPRKIRVNSVNPGPIATPIYGKTGMPDEALAGMSAALQQRIPLKRFGQAEEVAKLVAFLASDDASFVNGAEICVDGGINIHTVL